MFVNFSLAMFLKWFLRFRHFEPHVFETFVSLKERVTNLLCHVTLQHHVIKGSCDVVEASSSLYVFVVVVIAVVEI